MDADEGRGVPELEGIPDDWVQEDCRKRRWDMWWREPPRPRLTAAPAPQGSILTAGALREVVRNGEVYLVRDR